MEELVKEGLVRNIGLCNATVIKLHDIMCYAKIKPAIIQNEIHCHLQQRHLVQFARQNGIQVQAYS